MSKLKEEVAIEARDQCREMRRREKTFAECFRRKDELECTLDKLERLIAKAERRDHMEGDLECEAELRVEREHLCCLKRKLELEHRRNPELWKNLDRIEQLVEDNERKKRDINKLRRDHELVRCRGTVCYDYEDAIMSISMFMRNNVHEMRSEVIPQEAMDKMVEHIKDKVVSMLLLGELVYLYKQFRPFPENLIPVETKRTALERMLLSEFSHAKARVKVLTDQYRSTAKDLRLAEDAIRPLGKNVRRDIAVGRRSSAKKDSCQASDDSESDSKSKSEGLPSLTHPQILEIIEESSEFNMDIVDKACDKECERPPIFAHGGPEVEKRAKKPRDQKPKVVGQGRIHSPFLRPVRQMRQSLCPEFADVFDVEEATKKIPCKK